MKKIILNNFILEEFNEENKDYFNIIKKFDMDEQINKYIIATEDSFSDIVDYYMLSNDDTIYNKLYLVKSLDNKVIGSLELDGVMNNLYINYCILKKYRNNGYCTRLLREITMYLLRKVKSISLLIKEDNEKSKKLALKNGYNNVGYDEYGFYKYQINA